MLRITLSAAAFPILLVLAASHTPALAQTAAPAASGVRDEATGLGVAPPKPFATARASKAGQDAMFNITSPENVPPAANTNGVLCGVAFKGADANAALTQAELNATISSDEWIAGAKQTMSPLMTFTSHAVVDLAGVKGVQLWARPKLGPRSDQTHIYLVILETPKGRTTMSCATLAAPEAAQPHFDAIRETITLPR